MGCGLLLSSCGTCIYHTVAVGGQSCRPCPLKPFSLLYNPTTKKPSPLSVNDGTCRPSTALNKFPFPLLHHAPPVENPPPRSWTKLRWRPLLGRKRPMMMTEIRGPRASSSNRRTNGHVGTARDRFTSPLWATLLGKGTPSSPEKKETHIDPEILCVCVCVCVGGGHCHKVYFEPFKAMDSDGIECVKTTANCALVWLNFTRTFGAMNMS